MFVYEVKNVIPVRKQKFIVQNTQNNAFVMYVFYKKISVSIY